MLKIAMLSKWHVHAEDYANQLMKTGKVQITAVWDEDPVRGSEWAKELGAAFEPSLDAVLAREDVQAVACNSPTTMHKELFLAAAKAKKHIFTEKVLAVTAAEAQEIADAVKEAGIIFVISYSLRRSAVMCFAKKLVDEGIFGKIGEVRMRRSHNGVSGGFLPERWFDVGATGGGAMMDLGAHPMYLLSWLCGKPKRVSGVFTNLFGTSSDENSVAVIEFENGTIGVSETSFVSYNTPDILEIYGTDGTLMMRNDEVKLTTSRLKGITNGYITADMTGQTPPSTVESFVDACLGLAPAPADLNADEGIAVSLLMELAYKSNASNTMEVV